MLTSFPLLSSSFVFYLVLALLFISIIYIYFLSLGVQDPKLTNLKLGDRPQLWHVLSPVTVNYFHKKAPS